MVDGLETVNGCSSGQINYDSSSVENAMRCLKNMQVLEENPNFGKISDFAQTNRYYIENYIDRVDSKYYTNTAIETLGFTMKLLNLVDCYDFNVITDNNYVSDYFFRNLNDKTISLYDQNDYDDPIFNRWREDGSTISSSGCSFMAKCSVLSAFAGKKIPPESLLPYTNINSNESNVNRSLEIYDHFGINYERYGYGSTNGDINREIVVDALKNGKVVEMMVRQFDGKSANHVILLTGISEDGKYVYVNDSWGPMYNRTNHKDWLNSGYPIDKLYSSSEKNSGLGLSNGYAVIVDPADNVQQFALLSDFLDDEIIKL